MNKMLLKTILLITITVFAGCSLERNTPAETPAGNGQTESENPVIPFQLTSPAFDKGTVIDEQYTGFDAEIPELKWGTTPEGTVEVVLIMVDETIRMKHWVFAAAAASSGLTAAELKTVESGLPPAPKREDYATTGEYNTAANDYYRDTILPLPTTEHKFIPYMPPMPDDMQEYHDYSFVIFALDVNWDPEVLKYQGEYVESLITEYRTAFEGHILDEKVLNFKAKNIFI